MTAFEWIDLLLSLLRIAAWTAGLILSGMWLPGLLDAITDDRLHALTARPAVRLLGWIGFGAFITFPMIDLINALQTLLQIFAAPNGQVFTLFGPTPLAISAILPLLLMAVGYGGLCLASRDLLPDGGKNQALWIFLMLGTASLVYRGIYGLIGQVIYFQILDQNLNPAIGTAGFLILLGLAAAGYPLLLFIVNRILPRPVLGNRS